MSFINDRFLKEAKLMLETIPSNASESCFAFELAIFGYELTTSSEVIQIFEN